MREGAGVDQIVDRDDLDVGFGLMGGPQHASTDPAKSIDGYAYRHMCLFSCQLSAYTAATSSDESTPMG